MEYEKHYYAPEGLGEDGAYEEDTLFHENDWEK